MVRVLQTIFHFESTYTVLSQTISTQGGACTHRAVYVRRPSGGRGSRHEPALSTCPVAGLSTCTDYTMTTVVVDRDVDPAAFLASTAPFLRQGREFLLLGIASMAVKRFPATECFIVRRQAEPVNP
jgi:hypothetical protein